MEDDVHMSDVCAVYVITTVVREALVREGYASPPAVQLLHSDKLLYSPDIPGSWVRDPFMIQFLIFLWCGDGVVDE